MQFYVFIKRIPVIQDNVHERDIMKGYLRLNKLPPSVGLEPGTARRAGQH